MSWIALLGLPSGIRATSNGDFYTFPILTPCRVSGGWFSRYWSVALWTLGLRLQGDGICLWAVSRKSKKVVCSTQEIYERPSSRGTGANLRAFPRPCWLAPNIIYQNRVMGYGSNFESTLTIGMPSTVAWAINMRSKGSL